MCYVLKKTKNKKRWYGFGIALVVTSILVGGAATFVSQRSSAAMNVAWPQPNVTLNERQTFKVALNHTYNPNDVMLRWSVENAEQSGDMSYDGASFVADVNTDSWNWKRDNTYKVNFTTLDKQGNFLASSSVVVAAGTSPLSLALF